MKVTPAKHFINWQQDPQSNYLARLVFPDKTEELRIEVDLVAEMAVLNPFDFFLEPYRDKYPFQYEDADRRELAPYLVTQPLTPRFANYLENIPRKEVRTIDFLVELNTRLSRDIRYLIRMEPGVQTPKKRSRRRRARVATPAGCWSSCCDISGSPRASCRAI